MIDKKQKKTIINHCKELYEKGGQTSIFDYVRIYNTNHTDLIPFEHCKECMTKSPSLEHECLICGQETKESGKPKFYQVVLKPIKDVIAHVYPNKIGITLEDRLPNNAECDECGGNEWMLLPKKSNPIKQGGKPYIECLGCGLTTHL